MSYKKSLVLDFDGTIVDHCFPDIGPIKPGAIEAITRLRTKFHIIISSARNSSVFESRSSHDEMVKFIQENNIPHDQIDDGSFGKLPAIAYIDDRAVEFKDNWLEIASRFGV